MSDSHNAGKGTNRRDYDTQKWGENYDSIFRREVEKVCELHAAPCPDCDTEEPNEKEP